MPILSTLFLFALMLGLTLQLWLLRRHGRHVRAHRDQVPDAFAASIPLEAHQKAADYTLARIPLAGLDQVLGAGLLLVWTFGGGLNWLERHWAELGMSPLTTGVGLILSFFLVVGLLDLPFRVWRTFRIEARFGFNRTTASRFLVDLLLEALLALLLGTPLAWILLWLMASTGPWWWLGAWGVWMGFTLIMTWTYPSLIAPLFNRFKPLEDTALEHRLEQLLARCGFSSNGVFVMDGSRRSSHGNAYFTGLGNNKRIVFFDTLMERLSADELEAVLAHELGHFRCHHVRKRMITLALSSLAGMALLGWLSRHDWFYHSLGVTQVTDAAALLLFLLASPVFLQFFQPLLSLLMRHQEYEADDYACSQSAPEALSQALVKLYRDNASTLTPDPLYSAFHDSHPPAPLRIAHISTRIGPKSGQQP